MTNGQGDLFDEDGDRLCPRCNKPEPADCCWDGCRVAGECPLGYFARDIAESPRAVRELYEPRAHARRGDPVTSHEAAAKITSAEIRESQLAVMRVFRRFGPMHDKLLVERYTFEQEPWGMPVQEESGIRTRRKELVDMGWLEHSGEYFILPGKRRNRSKIWRIPNPSIS